MSNWRTNWDEDEEILKGAHKNLLCGCGSKNEEEIDGQEFVVDSIPEFIEILKNHKEIHLNFYEDENINIWLNIK